MKILTLGTFDCPHFGHYRLLKRCKELGQVYVGLNTDGFVLRYKTKVPLMTYGERKQTLEEWGYRVCANSQEDGTVKDVIEEVKPNMVVIGSDWLKKDYLKQIGLTAEYLEEKDIALCYLPYTKGVSTTKLKERISK